MTEHTQKLELLKALFGPDSFPQNGEQISLARFSVRLIGRFSWSWMLRVDFDNSLLAFAAKNSFSVQDAGLYSRAQNFLLEQREEMEVIVGEENAEHTSLIGF